MRITGLMCEAVKRRWEKIKNKIFIPSNGIPKVSHPEFTEHERLIFELPTYRLTRMKDYTDN
jgi:hypothetical protein